MQGISLENMDFTSRTGLRETYEHVFLREFIDLVAGSAGGRLAAWMQGPRFADPDSCLVETSLINGENGLYKADQGVPIAFTLKLRSFDGNSIISPGLNVSVRELVDPKTMTAPMPSPSSADGSSKVSSTPPSAEKVLPVSSTATAEKPEAWMAPFEPVVGDDGLSTIQCLSARPGCNLSLEELRFLYVTSQQQTVGSSGDSDVCSLSWTPRTAGTVMVEVLLDGLPVKGSPYVVVVAPSNVPLPDPSPAAAPADAPDVVMGATPFAITAQSDATINSFPTMDSLNIGKVPAGSSVECCGETVANDEGVWVKLVPGSSFVQEEMRHLDAWVLQSCSEMLGGTVLFTDPSGALSPMHPTPTPPSTTTTSISPLALTPADVPVGALAGGAFHFGSPFVFGAGAPAFAAPVAPSSLVAAAPVQATAPSPLVTAFPFRFGEKIPDSTPAKAVRRVSFHLPDGSSSKADENGEALMNNVAGARAECSPSMARCMRSVFAAHMWHTGVLHDAMALSAYLKFHPDLPRPKVKGDEKASLALTAFKEPPPLLDALAVGTRVLAMAPQATMILRGVVARVKPAEKPGRDEVMEGQRLEAKDRKNPHLVCE